MRYLKTRAATKTTRTRGFATPRAKAPVAETSALFLPLSKGGFDVWCDSYRTSRGITAYGGHLVFLSMFGTETAVRATWAAFVNQKRPSLELGGDFVSLDEVRYTTLRRLLAPHRLHLVMIHPDATSVVNPFGKFFYLLGERPIEQFWARFNRMCQVPLRTQWREQVWAIGLRTQLIRPLVGIGLQGFHVTTETDGWAKVVQDSIQTGELK